MATGCFRQAKNDGLQYIWCDTCCIKKSDSVELSEAITSMYKWYKGFEICYAYLEDVTKDDDPKEPCSMFRASKWFTRGWTLQELIAPRKFTLFSEEWAMIGSKASLCQTITAITDIPSHVLLVADALLDTSVAQRMSWAAKRITTKEEDIASCLIGLFGISMMPRYGEGKKELTRLQKLIMREYDDHTIFAWSRQATSDSRANSTYGNCPFLAESPAQFLGSHKVITRGHFKATPIPSSIGSCITLELPIFIIDDHYKPTPILSSIHSHVARDLSELTESQSNQMYCLLNCAIMGSQNKVFAIPIKFDPSDTKLYRSRYAKCLLVNRKSLETSLKCQCLHIHLRWKENIQAHEKLCYINTSEAPSSLLIGVYPESCWLRDSLITIPDETSQQAIFLRFQKNFNNCPLPLAVDQDFVVIIS